MLVNTNRPDDRSPAQRALDLAAWEEQKAAWVAQEISRQVRSARELAARYGNDPAALRAAAWAQPISMRGNQVAHEFQYAAAIIEADQRAAQQGA